MSENSATAKAGKESSKGGDAEGEKANKAQASKPIAKSKEKEKDKKDKADKPKSKELTNGKGGTPGAKDGHDEKKREKDKVREGEKVKDKDALREKDRKEKQREKDKEKDKEKPKEKERKKERRATDEERDESESRRKDRKSKDKSRKRRDPSSDSDYSRSRSRSRGRKSKQKSKAGGRNSGQQASRSRDAAEARVRTLALRPPVVKPAPAPAKTAEDLAREKAEFEEFCKAQAMMQERALVPAAEPAKPSPVLALGNFGGRAAGQGAPGQNDQISLFCRASGVDQRAEISLRGLPVHLAAEIMAGGPLLGVNSSAVLMAQIHKAEALSRTKNLSLGNTAAVQAAQAAGDLVSAFIAQYGVDASAEGALRGLPPDAQRQVIGEGPLRGLNASALLMSRIRRVQGSLAAVTSHPMGPGGMNPPAPAKSGVGPL